MSYIFDATKPVSPERQKMAQALLQRKQMEMMSPAAMPTTIGGGIGALAEGLTNGLEMRSLQNQAKAPTDAWGDMRAVGQPVPNPSGMGQPMSFGFNNPGGFLGGLKKIFG